VSANEVEPLKFRVRWMIRRDMPEVLEIEQAAFPISFRWSEDDFMHVLRRRTAIGMVAEECASERVAGFFIYESHAAAIELLTIAVGTEWRRCGAGRLMVERLKSKTTARRRSIRFDVNERNLAALKFFSALGFRAIATRRGVYDDCDDDAIAFRLTRDEMRFREYHQ